jgi:hypothetical protein
MGDSGVILSQDHHLEEKRGRAHVTLQGPDEALSLQPHEPHQTSIGTASIG